MKIKITNNNNSNNNNKVAYAIKIIFMEILIFLTYFQQNDILDRGTTFKQHLRMLIIYLTDLTAGRRTDDSQATRYFIEVLQIISA